MAADTTAIISSVMTASVSLAAILIAVFGILTSNRISLKNSGVGPDALKSYQKMIWLIIGFIALATASAILSGLFQLGFFLTDVRAILIMFILILGLIAVVMFVVAYTTRNK